MAFQQEREARQKQRTVLCLRGGEKWEENWGKKTLSVSQDGSGWSKTVVSGQGGPRDGRPGRGTRSRAGPSPSCVPGFQAWGCLCRSDGPASLLLPRLPPLPGHPSLPRTASGSPAIPCLAPKPQGRREMWGAERKSGDKRATVLIPLVIHDWTSE